MAKGDVNNPNAWNSGTPTLGTGTVAGPKVQGGIAGDAGNVPGDPDQFVGSYTFKSVSPTLATGTVASPTGKGDVGDIEGFPDIANNSQVKGLAAFTTGVPTLATQATTTPAGKGDVGDVGMSPTPKNEWNDSAGGTGTLTSWNTAASPTLGLGTVTHPGTQGDIDAIYSPNEHFAGVNPTWQPNTPTLATGTITVTHNGGGDIVDPFAWQDAVFFLTSQPYPIIYTENMSPGSQVVGGQLYFALVSYSENVSPGAHITGGVFTSSLFVYSNWPAENMTMGGQINGGSFFLGLVTYSNWPAENMSPSAQITGGNFFQGLVTYSNWPAENVSPACHITGGSLA